MKKREVEQMLAERKADKKVKVRKNGAKFDKAGNIKLGKCWTFSKLMGSKPVKCGAFGSVVGSCGKHCAACEAACYVIKSYRYTSVRMGHARNTLAIRADVRAAFLDLRGYLARAKKRPEMVRINQSGELESTEEFRLWIDLARRNPDVKFWIYSKAYDLMDPAVEEIPANLAVNISIWHECGIDFFLKWRHMKQVKAFVYDDGFDYAKFGIVATTACRAYDEKGKLNKSITCDKCKKCFRCTAATQVIFVKDHR